MSFLIIQLLAIAGISLAAKLPSSFKTCPRSSPDINTCISKSIESAIKDLKKGYPPLGIYSIDPLHITSVDIEQGSGPVSINLKFRELDIRGIYNAKINNFKSDIDNMTFTFNVAVPAATLDGLYSIDGKVLILPIKGDGNAHLGLEGITADVIFAGKPFKKDGQTYMRASQFDFNIVINKFNVNLANLFNGDKALGDNMNKFLNENWVDIFKELQPAIQQTFGLAFLEITNRIFTKVPYDQVFPNN